MNVRGRQTSLMTIALLAALIVIGSALALVLTVRNINNTITVVGGDFQVFADAGCTQPLTSWSWDQMRNGQQQVKDCYLLNTGDGTYVYVWWNTPDLSGSFTLQVTYTGSYWNSGAPYTVMLYPGQPVLVAVSLTPNGVPSGGYSFTLTFTGQNAP